MDSNLMSCPTCGHSVSNIAGACTYCGAVVDEKGPPPQADNKDNGEKAQPNASPPPLPNQQTRPVDEMPDEASQNPLAAPEQSESDAPQQPAASPASAKTSGPATEAPDDSPGEWTSVEGEAETKPAADDQDLNTAPPSGPQNQDGEDTSETDLTEVVDPESVPDAAADPAADETAASQRPEGETIPASDSVIPVDRHENQTETVADAIQSPPEPEGVDKSADLETSGEAQTEPVEMNATEQKSASLSAPETTPSLEKPGQEAETEPVDDIAPKNKADISADAFAKSTSKSLGDTIVLEVENEVEPVAAVSPDKTEEPARSEPRTEARKKNMPKADLAKAQAVKNQKAALAKAQALKKQKLALAKAAALKRKKAAQANSQANAEAPKKKGPAAAEPPPNVDPGPEANSRMQTLLEKYKGRVIGINYDNSADIKKAQLVEANAEYFSVFVKDQNLKYSYPLKAILSLIEGKDGVDAGNSKQPKKFIAVIKVYPLVLF